MDSTRITEKELILPSLYLMCINTNGCISTSNLIESLTQIMSPQGIAAEILPNRNDTYFSQKVRNLKSHNTLIAPGYALYKDGLYYITDKGKQVVYDNLTSINYILSSSFNYDDIRISLGKLIKLKDAQIFPYEELINEGVQKYSTTKVYTRSKKLREAAIEHFSKNGIICCDCCGFEFRSFYGEKFGEPCIEIHHLKPIFQYKSRSITQTIDSALTNLLPVCPNCHRVIHKNKITKDMISTFKQYISHKHTLR